MIILIQHSEHIYLQSTTSIERLRTESYITKYMTNILRLLVLNGFERVLVNIRALLNSFKVYSVYKYIIYYLIYIDQPREPFERQSVLLAAVNEQ
jgi:hypothetical protein